jgi:pyochelin biosynthetic protein PchG
LSATEGRPLRVVVCGTTFGQVYLQAFQLPGLPFRLTGVLGQGSDRSRACASYYGAPLFTDVAELPYDVDIACVVIRGGLLGGRGVELVRRLLERGIHVLQEHPLHHDELAECLRQARRHGVVYQLNSFYVHVAQTRAFIASARELLRLQRPLYVDAACGFQFAYSLLDMLGQALGGVRPWCLAPATEAGPALQALSGVEPPFRALDGVIAGVPLTLRVQNQLDPRDPDNFAHLMHRITVGTESGALTLVGTHGPVVWQPRPRYPRVPRDAGSRPYFAAESAPDLAGASAVVVGPTSAPSVRDIFRSEWPAAVGRALLQLRRAILDGEDPLRRGQHHLTLCRIWQQIAARLGPPKLLEGPLPEELSVEQLNALAMAAEAARA